MSAAVVFITGNAKKAEYLSSYLGIPVDHLKLELMEVQSLELRDVVQHKVRQAYAAAQRPVLVQDVSLEFTALGRLPGTFIRWFMDELSFDQLCALVNGKDRNAIARCVFGYFDGTNEAYFEGSLPGRIAEHPAGTGGFGWDPIFIPEGYDITRAEMGEEDDRKTYLRIQPFAELKEFLERLPSA